MAIIEGPRKGFAANFLSICMTPDAKGEYYAFSDQDDIWYEDKLKRGVDWLNKNNKNIPLLYCTRTEIAKADGGSYKNKRLSPPMTQEPAFENALVQSIAGGNTMLFNQKTKDLVKKFGGVVDVPSHDWWLYILVTASGGKVFYDMLPSLRYRQHSSNLIGSNIGMLALIRRALRFLRGDFKEYNDKNLTALLRNIEKIKEPYRNKLLNLVRSRRAAIKDRICYFNKSGAYRKGYQNILMKIGLLLGKV